MVNAGTLADKHYNKKNKKGSKASEAHPSNRGPWPSPTFPISQHQSPWIHPGPEPMSPCLTAIGSPAWLAGEMELLWELRQNTEDQFHRPQSWDHVTLAAVGCFWRPSLHLSPGQILFAFCRGLASNPLTSQALSILVYPVFNSPT